jgi:biopolymer transport protein ExbD
VVVQLDIDAAGQFRWNGEALAGRDALDARLREAATRPEQPELHLRPDRAAKYEYVAAALAGAQRAGLQKVGIVGSEQFAR